MAQRLDRVAALADEVAEVRTAAATAAAQGRRGREELSRLKEQKVPRRRQTMILATVFVSTQLHARASHPCQDCTQTLRGTSDGLTAPAPVLRYARSASRRKSPSARDVTLAPPQVELALAAAVELPSVAAAPMAPSFWALALALLCNIVLAGAWLRR